MVRFGKAEGRSLLTNAENKKHILNLAYKKSPTQIVANIT